MTNFEKVKEFNRKFKTIHNDSPTVISKELESLKFNLIAEETVEVQEAMESRNLHDIAKELCDLLYVAYGAADAYGIPIDKCFDVVHSSNMSKLDENGNPIFREDGKILKSNLYTPADLTKVF